MRPGAVAARKYVRRSEVREFEMHVPYRLREGIVSISL